MRRKNKKTNIANILAVIPARGGSKGIPNKNIRPFGGKPLIYYAIDVAKRSKYVNRIVVSTDSVKIADISRKYGAEVIMRPKSLAQDYTPMAPVLRHVADYLLRSEGYSPDIVVLLQPPSPLRKAIHVDKCIKKLIDTGCDSVTTVCEVEHNPHCIVRLNKGKTEFLMDGEVNPIRQRLPKFYRIDGSVYVMKRKVLDMSKGYVLGRDNRAIIIPHKYSADIDTPLDFEIGEFKFQKLTSNQVSLQSIFH